jgi:hypothetical protein
MAPCPLSLNLKKRSAPQALTTRQSYAGPRKNRHFARTIAARQECSNLLLIYITKMYLSRSTSQFSARTFDDDFSKLSTRRSCPLRIAFLLFFIWLASSAAFGSLIAIWQTSDGELERVENDKFGSNDQ